MTKVTFLPLDNNLLYLELNCHIETLTDSHHITFLCHKNQSNSHEKDVEESWTINKIKQIGAHLETIDIHIDSNTLNIIKNPRVTDPIYITYTISNTISKYNNNPKYISNSSHIII